MSFFAGKGFLKICLNLIKEEDEFSSPAAKKSSQPKKAWSYADIWATRFKDSSVNGLIILAQVESCSESYDNMKQLLELIGIEACNDPTLNYKNTPDCKMALSSLGLGAAGSDCCCPICEMRSRDFGDPDKMYEGGTLRTTKRIKDFAEKYQAEVKKREQSYLSKGKAVPTTKLSSAPYKNCEHPPLVMFSEDENLEVKEVLAPFQLHILLGLFLLIYNFLRSILMQVGSFVEIEDWPKECGFGKSSYWAAFNGNQTEKLLGNVDILRKLIRQDPRVDNYMSVNAALCALEALNEVKAACFGQYLADDYYQKIKEFGFHYMRIVYNIEELNKSIPKKETMFTFNVVLKAHILFAHVVPFLEYENDVKSKCFPNWIRKGMGYWSEQGM